MVAPTSPLTAALERDRIAPGDRWIPWPDGWRGEIATALIDAGDSPRGKEALWDPEARAARAAQ